MSHSQTPEVCVYDCMRLWDDIQTQTITDSKICGGIYSQRFAQLSVWQVPKCSGKFRESCLKVSKVSRGCQLCCREANPLRTGFTDVLWWWRKSLVSITHGIYQVKHWTLIVSLEASASLSDYLVYSDKVDQHWLLFLAELSRLLSSMWRQCWLLWLHWGFHFYLLMPWDHFPNGVCCGPDFPLHKSSTSKDPQVWDDTNGHRRSN